MLCQFKILNITGTRNNVRKFIEEQICSPFRTMFVKDLDTRLIIDIPKDGFFTIKGLNGVIVLCDRLEFPSQVSLKLDNITEFKEGKFTAYNSINTYKLGKHDIVTYTIPNILCNERFSVDDFLSLASNYKVILTLNCMNTTK